MKNVFFIFVLICLSVGIISSCSSDDEAVVATATTAAEAAPAALTGTATTIAGTTYTYTKSMMSRCRAAGVDSEEGDTLYYNKQLFLHDNKTLEYNDQTYSNSTCTSKLSSYTYNSTKNDGWDPASFDNASYEQNSTDRVFTDTITDNSSNVLDNATYYVLLYNGTCGDNTQGFHLIYPKSATEIQMTSGSCTTATSSVNFSAFFPMEEVYTTQ